MKLPKSIPTILFAGFMLFSCNNNKAAGENPVSDTTGTNTTSNAEDYHPDQRQEIPVTDSSNVVGTDSIAASESTPNTGTVKDLNAKKGTKDTTHKQ